MYPSAEIMNPEPPDATFLSRFGGLKGDPKKSSKKGSLKGPLLISFCAGDLITFVTLTFTTAGVTFSAKEAKLGRSDTFWFNWLQPELEMRKRVKNTNSFFCIIRFFIILKSN